jgi:hypothetical protein
MEHVSRESVNPPTVSRESVNPPSGASVDAKVTTRKLPRLPMRRKATPSSDDTVSNMHRLASGRTAVAMTAGAFVLVSLAATAGYSAGREVAMGEGPTGVV